MSKGNAMDYTDYLARKAAHATPVGFEPARPINAALFPFQRDIVAWALRRGRAAIFADCGMGKTAMQLEWASHVVEHTGGRVLILAPLAVATQTEDEGAKFGIAVRYCRAQSEVGDGISIANYEMLHAFDPSEFAGVVLDESSILKAYDGKTRTAIIDAFRSTPYRLACTATPSPNDFTELGNHSDFLGVMTRPEMLSMFFVHDGGSTQDWRLKGHAEDAFWRWVCSWAVMVRKPSDLGYDDGAFRLPALSISEHVVGVDHSAAHASGTLFRMEAVTLDEQRAARRGTIDGRVAEAARIVATKPDAPWLVWCELNAEGDALTAAIPGAVQVSGSDDAEVKAQRLHDFTAGRIRVIVTKPSIAGWGMNWQHCADVVFVGLSHSYEQWYQAIRRCWRFGQASEVTAHVIIAETEGRVVANLRRKEQDAARMGEAMAVHMRDIQDVGVKATARTFTAYRASRKLNLPQWLIRAAQEEADA